ncbi:MAG: hypothetical protein WCJ14_00210 [Verrucomicrobiota bacterium]
MKTATACLTLLAATLLVSCNDKQADSARPAAHVRETGKVLLVHYMPWYEAPSMRGKWGSHWTGHQSEHQPGRTGSNGLPDIWSNYHPLIGPYDSTDPDVLECHLLQMKLAGIDGVIADWYGISQTADYPSIHLGSRALFDAAGRFGMKFAACYEDRSVEYLLKLKQLQPDQVAQHLAGNTQWMQTNWFAYPQYFRVMGRPLLLNFGPIQVRDAAAWQRAFAALPERPAFYALHHLWKGVGADGGFTWVHQNAWDGNPDSATVRQRLHATYSAMSKNPNQVIVSAVPGFHDVYEHSLPGLDYRDGATLRDSLQVCMQGPWPIIQLVTWNDYGEGTMIEPTHEFGYRFLETIQQARRDEAAGEFAFTADDLRLPALLLARRKAAGATRESSDQISQLLNQGSCQQARQLLQAANHTH